jgi:thioredoxin-like negative regulator of GroEL
MKFPFFSRQYKLEKINTSKSYVLEDYSHFKKIINSHDDIIYFFYFYQENCEECRKNSKIINSLLNKNHDIKFIFVNANNKQHLKIFKKFDVDYVPRYLLFKNKKKLTEINKINNECVIQSEIDKLY